MALDAFSAAAQAWFRSSFGDPTEAQRQGWPAIAAGRHTLILAPTGSGKTLAAFLWAIDRLGAEPAVAGGGTRVVYVSPLRALAVDVERNLRAPLAGIALAAERLGLAWRPPTVGVRTGDTPASERRAQLRRPPEILVTTPESLYLVLTSQARAGLTGVSWVIVDEIHALVPTKRGAHLALSLERLEALTERPPQRIGLSATQRPLDEVARFLGGFEAPGRPRPVQIVDAGVRKPLELSVVVPVEDMAEPAGPAPVPVALPAWAQALPGAVAVPAASDGSGRAGADGVGEAPRRSIWPAIHPVLLDLIEAHRSTLVFVNARRLAERLAARLNELAAERAAVAAAAGEPEALLAPPEPAELVRAHHGSLAAEQRRGIEDALKDGSLRALVATSSLELGIDMGAVDLVVQVEAPPSVASGLQRVGRAGHHVGEPSRGVIVPKHRHDLLVAAVVARRMRAGVVEATHYPRNPLDVLAQQVVAATAVESWSVAALGELVRRAAPFAELGEEAWHATLDLLAGRYPSTEFAGLRPRVTWDRVADVLVARESARRLAVTSGGTIPDRGLFGVYLREGGRVGELDEEMVHESLTGEVFVLGASAWRIEEITFDRVIVSPAPGQPGKVPFWRGEGPGRPAELGFAIGAFVRELRAAEPAGARRRLEHDDGLDAWAADNLVRYLDEQAEATGVVPDDRTVVVERFPDEIGDWRVCVHAPFGARVLAPWALAVRARLGERLGLDVEVLWSDDGFVLRLPEAVEDVDAADLVPDVDDLVDALVAALPTSALFTSRFRENAARALLLPRRRPGQRTPLWQQRQRAADLLAVAVRYPSFPLLLETTREVLADVFDLASLRRLLEGLRERTVHLVRVDTPKASPFAQSLLFAWVGTYMYDYDAPLAERRAAALALDRDLLDELLGAEELRELLDAGVLADTEAALQRLGDAWAARSPDDVADLLAWLGPLTPEELAARCHGGAAEVGVWTAELVGSRRAIEVRVGGVGHVAAAGDAALLRDGLGVAIPPGLPAACTEPVARPLEQLVVRYARTHGPFTVTDVARRLCAPAERIAGALGALVDDGRVLVGEFRPDGTSREFCDPEVLRTLRRRSLAALRREIEPVAPVALAGFAPEWAGVGAGRRGPDALADAVASLQGAALAASVLEREVLAARVEGYRPADLDALCAAGELVWLGAGPLGPGDGRVRLYFREHVAALAPLVVPDPLDAAPDGAAAPGDGAAPGDEAPARLLRACLRRELRAAGACFWADLLAAVRADPAVGFAAGTAEVLEALWDLVWAGEVTNDTLAPLRAWVGAGRVRKRGAPPARRAAGRARRAAGVPPAAAGRWSLTERLVRGAPPVTEQATAWARQVLDRHGVVTRETVAAEGLPGGFAALYPVFAALEARGEARRGYFVDGLGAAQFALPGAVDRLRRFRSEVPGRAGEPAIVVLAATDPAQLYGSALPWPPTAGRPARVAGAQVVLAGGDAVAFVERSGRSVLTFPAAASTPGWPAALAGLLAGGGRRGRAVERIDGEPAATSPWAPALREAGLVDGYRGLVSRG